MHITLLVTEMTHLFGYMEESYEIVLQTMSGKWINLNRKPSVQA